MTDEQAVKVKERIEARRKRWEEAVSQVPPPVLHEYEQRVHQALASLTLAPGWKELKLVLFKQVMPQPMDLSNPNWGAQLAVDRAKIELANWLVRVVESAADRIAKQRQGET